MDVSPWVSAGVSDAVFEGDQESIETVDEGGVRAGVDVVELVWVCGLVIQFTVA
jgi:hypothetical protein